MGHDFEEGRWVARFRTTGISRFFQAGFLVFWLCGWAVGETFALGALVAGVLSHVPAGRSVFEALPLKMDTAFPPAALIFLGVWVSFWTLGGIMAAREALRILWSSDEVRWDGAGMILVRRLGPFTTRREIAADQIHGIRQTRPNRGIVVEVGTRIVEITRLGTSEERSALRTALRAAFPEPRHQGAESGLPDGWQADTDARGGHLLRPTPARARSRAIVGWIIGSMLVVAGLSVFAAGVGADATAVESGLRTLGVIPILGGAALILNFGLGTSEIHVRPGFVTFVRRALNREWRREITVGAIRIASHRDSDGDAHFALLIQGDGRKKTVASALHDPAELLALGRWLSDRAQRPLDLDRDVAEDD